MKNDTIYKENVEYRQVLKSKASKGEKLSDDERNWLLTNPIYNWKLGYPYLNKDILSFLPEMSYKVSIEIENSTYDNSVSVVIGASGNQGIIMTEECLLDFYGRQTSKKTTKILQVEIKKNLYKYGVEFKSNIGLMDVYYGCRYYDERAMLMKYELSSNGNPNFSMQKEIVSYNKVRYKCKNPKTNLYDMLVFTIEWSQIEVKN